MTLELPLEFFVEQAKSTVARIPEAGDRITLASEPRWYRGAAAGEMNYLGRVTITFRLQFTRITSQTILFVFHTGQEETVVLDATVSLRVFPRSATANRRKDFTPEQVTVAFPTCLAVTLDESQVDRYGPPGAATENTFFLWTGGGLRDLVAVRDPGSKRPSLVYSRNGTPGVVEPQSKRYSLAPILAVLSTVTSFTEQKGKWGPPVPVVWQSPPASPVAKILDILLKAGRNSARSLALASEKLHRPEWFYNGYELEGYQANLKLGVTADGCVAESRRDEQFKACLGLVIDGATARLRLEPADFALVGDQKNAFFGGFSVPVVRNALAERIGIAPRFVASFLESAKETAQIVRVGRDDKRERYLAFLAGALGERHIQVLLSGEFEVSDAFEADTDTFEAVVWERTIDEVSAGHQVAKYFFELIQNLRIWQRVLAG